MAVPDGDVAQAAGAHGAGDGGIGQDRHQGDGTPRIKEGFASGRYTFQTIWRVEAPMDWAASTTPASTSFREVSTIRAMKGAADTTRGRWRP